MANVCILYVKKAYVSISPDKGGVACVCISLSKEGVDLYEADVAGVYIVPNKVGVACACFGLSKEGVYLVCQS